MGVFPLIQAVPAQRALSFNHRHELSKTSKNGRRDEKTFPPRFLKIRSPLALTPPHCLASIYALAKQQPRWFVAAEVGHNFLSWK